MLKYEEEFYYDIKTIKLSLIKIADELKRMNDLKENKNKKEEQKLD